MKLSMRVVLLTVGILIGSVAGLLYWKFIGCEVHVLFLLLPISAHYMVQFWEDCCLVYSE